MFKKLTKFTVLLILLIPTASIFADQSRNLVIEWETIEFSTGYDVETRKKSGKSSLKSTSEPRMSLDLIIGEYEFRIRAKDKRGVPGPWSDWSPFKVEFPSVKRIKPKKNFLKESTKTHEDIEFIWSPLDKGVTYKISIYDEFGKRVESEILQNTKTILRVKSGKKYNWSVEAYQNAENARNQNHPRDLFWPFEIKSEIAKVLPKKKEIQEIASKAEKEIVSTSEVPVEIPEYKLTGLKFFGNYVGGFFNYQNIDIPSGTLNTFDSNYSSGYFFGFEKKFKDTSFWLGSSFQFFGLKLGQGQASTDKETLLFENKFNLGWTVESMGPLSKIQLSLSPRYTQIPRIVGAIGSSTASIGKPALWGIEFSALVSMPIKSSLLLDFQTDLVQNVNIAGLPSDQNSNSSLSWAISTGLNSVFYDIFIVNFSVKYFEERMKFSNSNGKSEIDFKGFLFLTGIQVKI